MGKGKKALILGYHDNPATGHTWSWYKMLQVEGYDVCHLSLLSRFSNEKSESNKYFIDAHSKKSFLYILFRVLNKVKIFLTQHSIKDEYNFFNTSKLFLYNARKILKKVGFMPDVIFVGWSDYFISPKTLRDLYNMTNAKIFIIMVDSHILGGGCHYPCDCKGYISGCEKCPALSKKGGARSLYKEKMKYLTNIPFTLVGSTYDGEKAKKVPFLKEKDFISVIHSQQIPFVKSKYEARKELGVTFDDFVIICGAVEVSLQNKRKGFCHLIEAINLLSGRISSTKKVTLLLAGDGDLSKYIICENLQVVSLGFVDTEKLFTAFYASDVFVSPSIDDSGPMMINFSILCGTPVVSFPIGIALDLVIPEKTGYLAAYMDSKSLSDGIYSFYIKQDSELTTFSENCILLMESCRKNETPWLKQALE